MQKKIAMQMPPLDWENVQHKVQKQESNQSRDDERKKNQLGVGNLLAELLSASDRISGRSAFQKDFKIKRFY